MDAEYSVRDAVTDEGMFFYCHGCKNRMYSVRKDILLYDGAYCPKCGRTLHLKKDEKELKYEES